MLENNFLHGIQDSIANYFMCITQNKLNLNIDFY